MSQQMTVKVIPMQPAEDDRCMDCQPPLDHRSAMHSLTSHIVDEPSTTGIEGGALAACTRHVDLLSQPPGHHSLQQAQWECSVPLLQPEDCIVEPAAAAAAAAAPCRRCQAAALVGGSGSGGRQPEQQRQQQFWCSGRGEGVVGKAAPIVIAYR